MELVLKDLKKEKNKILCLIEDIMFHDINNIFEIVNGDMDKIVKALIIYIDDNPKQLATMCYTDKKGNELTEDDLVGVPLSKIKLLNECVPEMMEIFDNNLTGKSEKLVLKDLKKEKNKILCLIEDIIFRDIFEIVNGGMDKFSKALIKNIYDNPKQLATMCYTDKEGNGLTEDDLVGVPLKIKLLNECVPEMMEIFANSFTGKSEEDGKKRVTVTKKKL